MYFSFNRNINRNFAKQPPQNYSAAPVVSNAYILLNTFGKNYMNRPVQKIKTRFNDLISTKAGTIIGENELMPERRDILHLSFLQNIFSCRRNFR